MMSGLQPAIKGITVPLECPRDIVSLGQKARDSCISWLSRNNFCELTHHVLCLGDDSFWKICSLYSVIEYQLTMAHDTYMMSQKGGQLPPATLSASPSWQTSLADLAGPGIYTTTLHKQQFRMVYTAAQAPY